MSIFLKEWSPSLGMPALVQASKSSFRDSAMVTALFSHPNKRLPPGAACPSPVAWLSWNLLEVCGPSKRDRGVPSRQQEEAPGKEKVIVCRRCLTHITEEDQRISVDGAHRHTFANPHGHVFDIGCFKSAAGCLGRGPASDEFAWFPGYSWRIVICSGCMAHLGWMFQSQGGDRFLGLIMDGLVSSH